MGNLIAKKILKKRWPGDLVEGTNQDADLEDQYTQENYLEADGDEEFYDDYFEGGIVAEKDYQPDPAGVKKKYFGGGIVADRQDQPKPPAIVNLFGGGIVARKVLQKAPHLAEGGVVQAQDSMRQAFNYPKPAPKKMNKGGMISPLAKAIKMKRGM